MIEVQIGNITKDDRDYLVEVALNDGQIITIVDEKGDLVDYTGEKAEIIVFASEDEKNQKDFLLYGTYMALYRHPNHDEIKHMLMDEYAISEEEAENSMKQSPTAALKTSNGTFLIPKKKEFKDGNNIKYKVLNFFFMELVNLESGNY